MVRIMSDSGSFLSTAEGEEIGVTICPLTVTIDDGTYRDYDDMDPSRFLALIAEGHMPTSSQPSQGVILEGYGKLAGEETIFISMAQGLSGTYDNAVAARSQMDNRDDITVVNTRTLGGAENYLVRRAAELAAEGADGARILKMLEETIPTVRSFLIPDDLEYIRRGGRLLKVDTRLAKVLKIVPVLEQTADGRHLGFHAIHRKDEKMARDVIAGFKALGAEDDGGKGWLFSFLHADNPKRLRAIRTAVHEAFPKATCKVFDLSPSFIVQGGPGCVAVQALKMWDGTSAHATAETVVAEGAEITEKSE